MRWSPPAQLLPREPPASPGLMKAPPELPGAAPSLTQRGSPARDRASSDGTSAPALAPSPGPRPSRLQDVPAGSPCPKPAPQGAGTAGAPLPPEQPGAGARGRTARGSRQLGAERGEPRAPSPGPGAGGPRPAPPPRSRQRARGRGRPGQSSARQRHREAPGGAAPSRSRLHSGSASPGGRRYRPHVVPVADASAAPVAPGCARPGGGARRELTGGSARLGWVGLGSLGLSVVRLCPARSRSARPGTAAEEQQGGGGPAPPAGWPSPTPRLRGN